MRQSLRHIVAGLFLLVFASYFSCITFFVHYHELKYGSGKEERTVIIVHSHPFKAATHTHSASAFRTIHAIALFLTLVPVAAALLTATPHSFKRYEAALQQNVERVIIRHFSLRAPPF